MRKERICHICNKKITKEEDLGIHNSERAFCEDCTEKYFEAIMRGEYDNLEEK